MIKINIVELSNRKNKNGRRPFKAILFEIHPDSCIFNNTGSLYNENGITWIRKYVELHLDSIRGMSLTCEFADTNERIEIIGHGDTGMEDGIPVFNNATMIGTFDHGYISNIDINGEPKCVCIGEGTLDEMRYKPFVDSLEKKLLCGETPHGSIEIFKNPEKESIEYLDGYKPQGRIPVDFIFSGFALLGIRPADQAASLIELNNKMIKEDKTMDEKTLNAFVSDIKQTILETISKNDEAETKIAEMKADIKEKEAKIEELDERCRALEEEATQKEDLLKQKDVEIESLKDEKTSLEIEKRKGEMNTVLAGYTDEEKAYAKEDLEAFEKDPMNIEIDSVITKINASAYAALKAEAAKVAEQNAKNTVEDIFGDVADIDGSSENVSIF